MASNKNRVALVGKIGCGKTTLRQKLSNEQIHYKKTQAIDYTEAFIDTPGEFIDMPFFCRNAINVACDAGLLCVVIAANDDQNKLPPNFACTFNGPVIGIITKTDLEDADVERARRNLVYAGVNKKKIYPVSSYNGEGIENLDHTIRSIVTDLGKRIKSPNAR